MSIQHRPDRPKPWRARYYGPDGKERSRSFRRKIDAERFLAAQTTDIARGQWLDAARGRTPVADLVEQWYRTTVDLRPSTRVRIRGVLDNYVLPQWGGHDVAGVEHLAVREWVAELSADGLAPRSVRKVFHTFAKVMAVAVDAGMVAASPCDRVPLPRAGHDEMRFLTAGQVLTLADAIDERYRTMALVLGFGGLRMSEAVGLRRRHVDALRGTVQILETGVEAGGIVTFGPPKSRAGRRTVPLATVAADALRDHLAERPDPGAHVFTSPEGKVLRATTWRRRFFDPAVRSVGLESLRPHDLRHSAVSLWIAAGDNPKVVSVRAGHSSVAFTLDVYGHLYPEHDERSRARLDALIAEAEPTQVWRSIAGAG